MENKGIYLHIPFCSSKCAYCNFYSRVSNELEYNKYTNALCTELNRYKVRFSIRADTLYIGGGTPTVLGAERLSKIINTAKPMLTKSAEITVECNPTAITREDFVVLKKAGVNRLSIGVQSGIESELSVLNRKHTNKDVINTVNFAKSAGITNISVDIMLGIPNQTLSSLKKSLDFLISLNPTHISAYILKIEPNTPFGKAECLPNLPNEDSVAQMYLFTSDYFKKHNFEHYEISNFAKENYRSVHNMKYWQDKEYLGLGPSAYSFLNKKRFHFENSTEKFITSPKEIFDEPGGTKEEYVMLRLRLSDGLNFEQYKLKFNCDFPLSAIKRAEKLQSAGYLTVDNKKIALTEKGYLVSNSVILNILSNDFI